MEHFDVVSATKTYPVHIGPGLRHRFVEWLPKDFSTYLIVSDDIVAARYLDDVAVALKENRVHAFTVKNGEQAKSFETYYDGLTFALEKGLDRKSAVVALGGGVVGDLAGFIAATYMRGIGFIQMPTTLLAHDSSVGGKTGINHPFGKNLIGSFYPPDAVIFDTETLSTLPMEQVRSGFAEVIKHGLIRDAAMFEDLRRAIPTGEHLAAETFEHILPRSIRVKADIVASDEKELGVRAHLNFGHTLGHALEAELGYGAITHGEAVVIGMLFAMRLSEAYYLNKLPIARMTEWLQDLGYPVAIPEILDAEALLARMKRDKKAENERIRFVLMKRVGEVETVFLEDAFILRQLRIDMNDSIR
ncbi:MAG TPA: 3-dehydroquinate synthase [Bacillales bacterium]|nr:3-dehydroquinate synthase [Bacillales bacterium]